MYLQPATCMVVNNFVLFSFLSGQFGCNFVYQADQKSMDHTALPSLTVKCGTLIIVTTTTVPPHVRNTYADSHLKAFFRWAFE